MEAELSQDESLAALRDALSKICHQLCRAVDGEFDWRIALDQPDPDVAKLIVLINFVISSARRALARVEIERIRHRRILSSSLDPIISIDEKGIIQVASDSVEHVFGWPADELAGQNVSVLMPEPNRSTHDGFLAAYIETGEAKVVGSVREVEAVRRDGARFPVEIRVSRVDLPGREMPLFAGIIRDLSEQRALQSQLLHAQKMESIGQLAAGIAHEINTPTQYIGDNLRFLQESFEELRTILEPAAALAERDPSEGVDAGTRAKLAAACAAADLPYLVDEIPTAISQSLDGVERVASIVRAMKDFSHPTEGAIVDADLNRALESTLTVARNEWKYVAEAVLDLDPDLPLVPCLPDELNQVFLNLIVNAAHAIGERAEREGTTALGTITIRTRRREDRVELSVADTGCGVPPELRERIFEPFFTTKEVGKGTGQGLAITHGVVVEKHAGQIELRDVEGGGTEFVIHLPLEPRGDPHL